MAHHHSHSITTLRQRLQEKRSEKRTPRKAPSKSSLTQKISHQWIKWAIFLCLSGSLTTWIAFGWFLLQDLLHFAFEVPFFSFLDNKFSTSELQHLLVQSYLPYVLRQPAFTQTWQVLGFVSLIFFFFLLVFQLMHVVQSRKKHHKWISRSFLHLVSVSLLLLFPATIVLAVPHVVVSTLLQKTESELSQNIESLKNTTQQQSGIETDTQKIQALLPQNTLPLKLESTQFDSALLLATYHIKPTDTFAKAVVLPRFLASTQLPAFPYEAALISTDSQSTLLLNERTLQKETLGIFLPIIAEKAVSQKVPASQLQKMSQLSIALLEKRDYNTLQTKKTEEKKQEIQKYIRTVESQISANAAELQRIEENIQKIEGDKQGYQQRTNDLLSQCRTQMAEKAATECDPLEDIRNTNLAEIDAALTSWYNAKQTYTNFAPRLTQSLRAAQANYESFVEFPITAEYQDGVFEAPNSISIKYYLPAEAEKRSTRQYVFTTIHELLHALSHNSEKDLPIFLEEGLTDWYAYQATKEMTHLNFAELHYTNEVALVQKLEELFTPQVLQDLYFSKESTDFSTLFIEKFGKETYNTFMSLGEELSYTSAQNPGKRGEIAGEMLKLISK